MRMLVWILALVHQGARLRGTRRLRLDIGGSDRQSRRADHGLHSPGADQPEPGRGRGYMDPAHWMRRTRFRLTGAICRTPTSMPGGPSPR